MPTSIALVGEYNPRFVAHTAIPRALELANKQLGIDCNWAWLETEQMENTTVCNTILAEFSAIWLVPGSPYASMEGALNVIRFARETNLPFLGTCGGFQHALIEYARHICGVSEADHAETNPEGPALVVTALSCSLIEKTGQIFFKPYSRLSAMFQDQTSTETYHCNYGLNPAWIDRFATAGIAFTGFDAANQVRVFELPTHPFFIGTLFQPERAALQGKLHPLIQAFVLASVN